MNILGKFLQWFDETAFWHWLSKNIIAHFTFRWWGYTKFDFKYLNEIENIVEKARTDLEYVYAFTLADKLSLSSILIRAVSKSDWSHAGLIVNTQAIHMKGKGMVVQDLPNLLKECDDFAIVKFKIKDPAVIEARFAQYRKDQAKIRYDFEQELDEQAHPSERPDLYCSELVYVTVKDQADVKVSTIAGRKVFSPDDVFKQGEKVFVFKS